MQVFNNSNVESMYMTNGTTQILLSDTSKDKKNLLSNRNMNGLSIAKIFLKQYLIDLIYCSIKISNNYIFITTLRFEQIDYSKEIILYVLYQKEKELKNYTKGQIF